MHVSHSFAGTILCHLAALHGTSVPWQSQELQHSIQDPYLNLAFYVGGLSLVSL